MQADDHRRSRWALFVDSEPDCASENVSMRTLHAVRRLIAWTTAEPCMPHDAWQVMAQIRRSEAESRSRVRVSQGTRLGIERPFAYGRYFSSMDGSLEVTNNVLT